MLLSLAEQFNKEIAKKYFPGRPFSLWNDAVQENDVCGVIIDEKTEVQLLTKTKNIYTNARLYVYYDNELFDVNESRVSEYQNAAFQLKNWWIVKDINKIKVKVNIALKKEIFDTYPIVLQVESTSQCNAKCIMCSHYYKDINDGEHLTLDKCKMLEEALPYTETVMLHGIGEPFLNPDIVELLSFYKKFGVHLSTFTNMTVLTPRILEAIGQSFSALHISCDGCTSEIFEKIRGNLKFKSFLRNVKLLHKAYPEIKLHMHVVAMRQNLMQLDKFIQFASELGFTSVTYSNLTVNPLIRNDGDSLRKFPVMAKHKFFLAENAAQKLGIRISYPKEYKDYQDNEEEYFNEFELYQSQELFTDGLELHKRIEKFDYFYLYATEALSLGELEMTKYECEGLCDWLSECAYFDLDGNLVLCCSKYYFTMGNILDYNSFKDLWNSSQYKIIRKIFFNGFIPKVCQGCRYIVDGSMKNLCLKNDDEDFKKMQPVGKLYQKLLE